jgi:hypothetical protein
MFQPWEEFQMPKKPNNKDPEKPGRTKGKNAGTGQSRKTRSPVPATNANRAESGKQVNSPR